MDKINVAKSGYEEMTYDQLQQKQFKNKVPIRTLNKIQPRSQGFSSFPGPRLNKTCLWRASSEGKPKKQVRSFLIPYASRNNFMVYGTNKRYWAFGAHFFPLSKHTAFKHKLVSRFARAFRQWCFLKYRIQSDDVKLTWQLSECLFTDRTVMKTGHFDCTRYRGIFQNILY